MTTDLATTALRLTDLPSVARREQSLLSAALGSLFTRPEADRAISRALGYPTWPQPLTLLPHIAADLCHTTEQLSTYLEYIARVAPQVINALATRDWPTSQPGAADAAWLLLQHADAHNEERTALLPLIAEAVESGDADPRHLAMLTDRTLTLQGQPQRYGTLRLIRDDRPHLLYPLDGSTEDTDRERDMIGLASLAGDDSFAYSPLNPYGQARSCPTNKWLPQGVATLQPDPVDTSGDVAPGPVPSGSTGIYLAATVRYRNSMVRLREQLPASLHSTARWLDIDPLTRASCPIDAGLALNQLAARICLTDVTRSDVVIAFAEHRRSHGLGMELGAALAHRIPVILIGPPRCSFDMLPDVTLATSIHEALTLATDHRTHRSQRPHPPIPAAGAYDDDREAVQP